jgi:hypothetical protein
MKTEISKNLLTTNEDTGNQYTELEMETFEAMDNGTIIGKADTISKVKDVNDKNIIDYTSGFLFHPFMVGKSKVYAAINVQLTRGMDFTGLYDVYLLHPNLGSNYFSMERNYDDKQNMYWDSNYALPYIGDEYIKEIGLAIDNWEACKRKNRKVL